MEDGVLAGLGQGPGVLHERLPALVEGLEWVTAALDLIAIAVMLLGALRFVAGFLGAEVARPASVRLRAIDAQRAGLGRYILAGLELLIVSDIVHTALSLALGDLVFLGLLVLIRSAISFFLDREIREIREAEEGDGREAEG